MKLKFVCHRRKPPNGRPVVLEDFRPLGESLDWELGQLYWLSAGIRAFLGGDVPFRITSDSNLSRKSAEVLFAALAAAAAKGPLPGIIRVLELGAGAGLFARFFLDHFRDLCRGHGVDYYERLRYLATDRSPAILGDLARHRVLAGHAGHCEARWADAALADFGLKDADTGFQAVIVNYRLDSLPVAVLKFENDRAFLLHVRTCLAPGIVPGQGPGLTLDEIRRRAASRETAARAPLVELWRSLSVEREYRPVHLDAVAFGETAARHAGGRDAVVLHNFGAIACLENASKRLRPGGLILINDYDDSPFDEATQSYRHQRFGGATAMGLNAALLGTRFDGRLDCEWIVPPGAHRHLCSRLLGRGLAAETKAAFCDRFSAAAYEWHFGPIEQARNFIQAGAHDSARATFERALERQPRNWALMLEFAEFLTFTLRDHAAALSLTSAALNLNPLAPGLWNTHGDCLYYLGRTDEAHAAFERAIELDPEDVRGRYNLSFTWRRRGDVAAALRVIEEGLALDRNRAYTERLVAQRSEILPASPVAADAKRLNSSAAEITTSSSRPPRRSAAPRRLVKAGTPLTVNAT